MLLNNRGFSSLEAAAVLVSASAAVSILFFIAYLCFTRIWVRHLSHEALLCAAKGNSAIRCELKMKKGLEILGGLLKPRITLQADREKLRYLLQVQYKIHNWNFATTHKLNERALWK